MRRSGELEKAYEVGVTLEGSSHEVLEAWLEKAKMRLECEKILEQVRLHAKQNEWSVCQQTRES